MNRELHHACRNGNAQHVELLLAYGAQLDTPNFAGNTPLHITASNNQVYLSYLQRFSI